MRLPRVRFTVRRLMAVVAALAMILGVAVLYQRPLLTRDYFVNRAAGRDPGPTSPDRVPQATRGPSASATIGDQEAIEVLATPTADGREVRVSVVGDVGGGTIRLPGSGGRVTELRLGAWMRRGVAVVAEVTDEATGDVSYYWRTALLDRKHRWTASPAGVEFLKSKIDYDLGSVVNTDEDTIYMVLSRHQRNMTGQAVGGYVFIHVCPTGSTKGQLFPFEASEKVKQ